MGLCKGDWEKRASGAGGADPVRRNVKFYSPTWEPSEQKTSDLLFLILSQHKDVMKWFLFKNSFAGVNHMNQVSSRVH